MIQKRFLEPVAVGMEMVLPAGKEGRKEEGKEAHPRIISLFTKKTHKVQANERERDQMIVQPDSACRGSQLSKHREPHVFLSLTPRMIGGGDRLTLEHDSFTRSLQPVRGGGAYLPGGL